MSNTLTWSLLPRGRAAQRLALACASAWTAVAVIALAIVLQVVHATGSFSTAGMAAAAYGLAAAFLGVPRSRLVDRYGPRRVFPALTLVHVAALCGMILAGRSGAPGAVHVVLAAVISGSTPPLIGYARGRWSDVVPAEDLPRAYALTALLGDLAQIGGAPAAGLLATLVDPAAGLATAAVFTTIGMLLLLRSADGGSAAPAEPADTDGEDTADRAGAGADTARGVAIRFPGLRTLTVGGIGAGVALGAVDIAATALAASRDSSWAVGLVLGALGVGGVVGSILSPRLAERYPADLRYAGGLTALLLSSVPLIATPPLAVVAALLLLAGLAWGVTNVVIYELLDMVVPKNRATEAWAWLSTAESLGAAGGASLAGVIASDSVSMSFALVSGAVLAALVAGLVGRRTLAAVESVPPAVAQKA